MATPAAPETSLALEMLLRLPQLGPAGLSAISRLTERGDWRGRTLAFSAAGRIVRDDPSAWRPDPWRHLVARRIPGLRGRFPSTGPRGAFVSGVIANGVADRVWIVRAAAALALGECRDAALASKLRPLLRDPLRPVRVAAAAALGACGSPPSESAAEILAGADPAPERVGDTALSLEWLARLAATHSAVVAEWSRVAGAEARPSGDSSAWAAFLAGEVFPEKTDSREAEILRYAQEKDTHYNVTKPFTRVNRDQNVRLLRAFLTVAENMRVPHDGLVLDLGGGAAWVSDLLAKLGYRPITLDIAPALLRIGRDRFTRENLRFRPVSGDMTALPIVTGAVDAVVVIDALHHVPDVPAVFREAHRVLQQGGQFVLAEPGEGHAESEKSRGEMLEHGVCEREIHLFEAVRYGREAGFDRVEVISHHEPIVSFTPEDLEAAVAAPSERWRVTNGGQPISYDSFVLQSILSHPVIVFRKGERPIDSRMPRTLRAEIDPSLSREGARVSGTVGVTNVGDTIWLHGKGDEAGRVRLGLQLQTPERKLLNMDFARAVLPHEVAPGGKVQIAVDVALPDPAASYALKLDMVDEHVCWFEDMGSRPVYVVL
jgi:ubiquinone/menaquinone biosynthesis C-methylase UbiE